MKMLVLIGSQSVGDSLCAIPAIKHLSDVYNQKIHVFTHQKELLKNFPYIILTDNHIPEQDDIFIESFRPDLYIHTRFDIRQFHAISSGFQLLPEEMQIDFYPDEYQEIEKLPQNYVVIHPVKTWPSRSWEKERWQMLVDELNKINIPVVAVGKNASEPGFYTINKPVYDVNIKYGLNLINNLDIHQTWHILNKSAITVTMDSGILHLAGTTDTHIIQLGSSINPKLRSPYRHGTQDYKYSYVLGECKLFCASNMKYGIEHHNKHNAMPPVPFCLERRDSIGNDDMPDKNIYKCHPTVEQVYNEIVKNYKFPNKGKIIL